VHALELVLGVGLFVRLAVEWVPRRPLVHMNNFSWAASCRLQALLVQVEWQLERVYLQQLKFARRLLPVRVLRGTLL